MAAAPHVLVAGSANMDFVVRAGHIPTPGETVLGEGFVVLPGGKGANQAMACARAGGVPTTMLLALGSDPWADAIEQALRADGVQPAIVRVAGSASGAAFICVDASGRNAITVAPGANARLRAGDLPSLDGVGHLLLQLETPLATVTAFAQRARSAGVVVVLNAAPASVLPAALLDAVDVLIVNEGELAQVSPDGPDIASRMAALPVACVIVTLGERGCCARLDGSFHLQPGYAVGVIDTTGAGDTFCGSVVAALASGQPLAQALALAGAASALACTRLGAQPGIPARDEVLAFLAAAPAASAAAIRELARYCGLG